MKYSVFYRIFENLEMHSQFRIEAPVLLLASERSERDTIRGNKWKSEIYIYIYIYMVRARHFSSAGLALRIVGGVKCQPF